MSKSKVIIEFDNKLHANTFAMYLEENGISDYVNSSQHQTAIDAGADPLEEEVIVTYDENRSYFSEHTVETIE